MTIPAWPSINYYVQRDSWQCPELALPPLASDMNSGTTRRRNKYTLRISQMQFNISMNDADLAVFKTFYNSTLGCGASRFTMNVWNGAAYVSRTVAFQKDKAPSLSPHAVGHTLVSIALDVEAL